MPALNLNMNDKVVLESLDGMLTDKHMDAVSELLSSQYPRLLGLQSSLLSQSKEGFTLTKFSGGFMPEGWLSISNTI